MLNSSSQLPILLYGIWWGTVSAIATAALDGTVVACLAAYTLGGNAALALKVLLSALEKRQPTTGELFITRCPPSPMKIIDPEIGNKASTRGNLRHQAIDATVSCDPQMGNWYGAHESRLGGRRSARHRNVPG